MKLPILSQLSFLLLAGTSSSKDKPSLIDSSKPNNNVYIEAEELIERFTDLENSWNNPALHERWPALNSMIDDLKNMVESCKSELFNEQLQESCNSGKRSASEERIRGSKQQILSNQAMLETLAEEQSVILQDMKKYKEATMNQRKSLANPNRSKKRQKKTVQKYNKPLQDKLKQLKQCSKGITDEIKVLEEGIEQDELDLIMEELEFETMKDHVNCQVLRRQKKIRNQIARITDLLESDQKTI